MSTGTGAARILLPEDPVAIPEGLKAILEQDGMRIMNCHDLSISRTNDRDLLVNAMLMRSLILAAPLGGLATAAPYTPAAPAQPPPRSSP